MTLTAADVAKLSRLLDQALDLPVTEREAWLSQAMTGELAHLGPTLRELLAKEASQRTGELIDRLPAFTLAAEVTHCAFSIGDTVGPYRLLRELGRGGMGEVWLAERIDGHLKRAVALKLPMLSARRSVLVQRFARERDILGSLAHPHIARLYDAGLADDGQPYLALEHVEGKPITAYCDDGALDARSRIALLRQVMDAVQYAHANLVIHRDLKPSNVLVTPDGKAMLLDFGIAKLLQAEQTEAGATELTHLGGHAMTLHYAAPEQLAGAPVSITTDVWALGVLLYELLAGQRPFAASTRSALEREVMDADPLRPSQQPGTVMRQIKRSHVSDLDTIVLKALKKSPAERYPTVNALAEDLDRLERGETVLARPDSLGYRVRKFTQRNRVPVAAGSLVALALITVSALALIQAGEARRQASTAQQETKRAQAVQAFMTDLFESNSTRGDDPIAAQRRTARELLDRGAARLDEALRDEPQSRFEVMRTLADIYWQLRLDGEASGIEGRRVELARQIFDRRDPRLAATLLEYAETISETVHRDQIPKLVDEALATLDAIGDHTSVMRGQALVIASEYWSHLSLARTLKAANEAIAFLERHHPASDRLVQAYMRVGRSLIYRGELQAAVDPIERSLAHAQHKEAAVAAAFAWSPVSALADVRMAELKLDEAEKLLRRELALATQVHGEEHGTTATSKARLGNLLQEIGRHEEAEALHRAVRRATGPGGPRMEEYQRQFVLGILGLRLLERGRPDLLAPILQADIEELRRTIPRSGVAILRQRLWALLQANLGNAEAARAALREAQTLWTAFTEGSDASRADSGFALAQGQIAIAAGQAAEALPWLDPARPAMPRDAINLRLARARALLALDRPGDAGESARSALESILALPEGYRPVPAEADARLLIGLARLHQGDARAAEDSLQRAVALRRLHDAPDSLWVAQTQIALATCLTQLGRPDTARSLLSDAKRIHAALGDAAKLHASTLARADSALRVAPQGVAPP